MWVQRMLSVFLLLVTLSLCEGAIICGNLICSGAGVYCCGSHCCSSIWSLWWFWIIWVFFFTCLGSCGWWCGRRYRERRYRQAAEYVIVQQPTPQGYSQSYSTYGAVERIQAPPYTPETKPPGYTNAPPPAYASQ